jgi:hypothetical protein
MFCPRSVKLSCLVMLLGALCLPLVWSAAASAMYCTVTELSNSGDRALAFAVNASGQVAGYDRTGATVTASRWSSDNTRTCLNTYESVGNGINAGGWVAGNTGSTATVWMADNTKVVLPTPGNPSDFSSSVAKGINSSCQAVGNFGAGPAGYPKYRPALWNLNSSGSVTGAVVLSLFSYCGNPVDAAPNFNTANAINDSGVIVGKSSYAYDVVGGSASSDHAALWTVSGTASTIYNLGGFAAGGNAVTSEALGINKAGTKVVGYSNFAAAGGGVTHGCLWNLDGGSVSSVVDLGALASASNSKASQINSAGVIAGYSNGSSNFLPYACIWTVNGTTATIRNLNSLIDPNSGWMALRWAYSINDYGQIAGVGIRNGGAIYDYRPFLLDWLGGDSNYDGTVSGADLNVVLSNFGQTGKDWSQGDFTRDGLVDGADLNIVLSNYNKSVGSSVSMAVPEPSTLLLAVAGLAGLVAYPLRRRTPTDTWGATRRRASSW